MLLAPELFVAAGALCTSLYTLYPFHGICFDNVLTRRFNKTPIIASPSGHQTKSPWISLHLSSTCFAILILQRSNHTL